MTRALIVTPLLVLLLAACAPGALGDRGNPFDLRRDGAVRVSPGGSAFMRISYPTGAFGLARDAFADAFAVPLGAGGRGARVTSSFELLDVAAPPGWRWTLDDVWSESRAGVPPALVVTLRLDVPQDARLGGQAIGATLRAKPSGGRESVSVVVQVVPRP